jgi:hypothetical protein
MERTFVNEVGAVKQIGEVELGLRALAALETPSDLHPSWGYVLPERFQERQ